MATSEYHTKINSYITSKFPLAKKRNIREQDSLLDTGVVDSLGILDLVQYLETEFSILISDDELFPEYFKSVTSIVAFVASKVAAREKSQHERSDLHPVSPAGE